MDEHPDRIAQFYQEKTLLISGASGFLGKVLLEKLLRSCNGVKKIYLLIRKKKGKDPEERTREIIKGPLFDLLRKSGEEVFEKIITICSDVSAVDLSLCFEDRRRLIEEVEIIFHCAASVRFDEPLKKAVILNGRGTKLMLELAKSCRKLIVFSHFSTAFSHTNQEVLFEKSYPAPADPHQIIKFCEWLGDDVIEKVQDNIIGEYPNSYGYSKVLGEALVDEAMKDIPAIILRPSIVTPICEEPLPGWTDNINGPMGLLIGAGKGVIRTMYCDGEACADYIPVDIVANAAICFTFFYTINKHQRHYNLTSSSEHKLSFHELIRLGRIVVTKRMPLNVGLWYPGGTIKKSRFLHEIDFFLYQWLPAVFIDVILFLFGYPPILKKVQRRILKGYSVFEYYANRQWNFSNEAGIKMRNTFLNPREKTIYRLHGDGINYLDYFTDCTLAARRYILKERDDQIPAARRHMKIMFWIDRICKIFVVLGLVFVLWKYLNY